MSRSVITVVAGVAIAVATAGLASAKTYKLSAFTPKGQVMWDQYPAQFAEKIKLATDGEITVKPYPSGALASLFEGHKAVMDGRADMAYHYGAFEVNQNPEAAFIGDIPGGMGPEAKTMWILAGGGEKLWTEYRHSRGQHGMFCGIMGSELFANSHKRIQTLDDLKGYKYRTAGANTWVMRALGAAPNLVPGPEVFTMLERKAIDGTEYLTPFGNHQLGFDKVAKFVIYPGIHAPSALQELIMSKKTWDGISKKNQQKIKIVCDSIVLRGHAHISMRDMQAMKAIKANGRNELVELDPAVIKAFRKAGRDWAATKIKEQNAKGNPWMERLAKSYYSFMDDWSNNTRHRVSDNR